MFEAESRIIRGLVCLTKFCNEEPALASLYNDEDAEYPMQGEMD